MRPDLQVGKRRTVRLDPNVESLNLSRTKIRPTISRCDTPRKLLRIQGTNSEIDA